MYHLEWGGNGYEIGFDGKENLVLGRCCFSLAHCADIVETDYLQKSCYVLCNDGGTDSGWEMVSMLGSENVEYFTQSDTISVLMDNVEDLFT